MDARGFFGQLFNRPGRFGTGDQGEFPPAGNPAPGAPQPRSSPQMDPAAELSQLQSQWQGKPNIPPQVVARVKELRAQLGR